MQLDVLALPVVGAYLLASYGRHLKYYHQYVSPQRLIFHAVGIGLGALVVVSLVMRLCGWEGSRPKIAGTVTTGLAGAPEYFLESVLTFGLLILITAVTAEWGPSSSPTINRHLRKAILTVGDELDNLLLYAIDHGETLLVSLDNDKFYVAYILSTPSPRETRYISIRPMLSGFRDARKELHFTTIYPARAETVEGGNPYEVVIELADITSFARWDISVYEARFATDR